MTGMGLMGTLRLIENEHQRLIKQKYGGADTMMDEAHWSLLKVNPQKQRGYVELLGQYCPGVELYVPVYNRVVRPHGLRRPIKVTRPVYPGYLFLRVGMEEMRKPVTLPVRASWVRFGGKIEEIPGYVIQKIKQMEKANELVREVKGDSPYVPGARVLVRHEVRDIRAVVVRLVKGNRVEVDTEMCRVIVPVHRVEVIK